MFAARTARCGPRKGQVLTAATAVDDPYCSCKLTCRTAIFSAADARAFCSKSTC